MKDYGHFIGGGDIPEETARKLNEILGPGENGGTEFCDCGCHRRGSSMMHFAPRGASAFS